MPNRDVYVRAVVSAGCILAGVNAVGSPQMSALTPKDVADAISWGLNGQPRPYLLYHMTGGTAARPATVAAESPIVGAVYTPFLRVALAARNARLAGHTFGEQDITPQLAEPVVYVAFRWYCCDADRPDPSTFDPFVPFDYQIAERGKEQFLANWSHLSAAPLWVSRDIALLSHFGGDLPYRDVVLVAGYPLSVLKGPNTAFVIYRKLDQNGSYQYITKEQIRIGRVRAEDYSNWR
jgi:hypothetical protein